MSRIPPENEAARSLEESFRRLGEMRAQDGRRKRGRTPVARGLLIAVAVLLALSAVAAGTKVFVADGGPVSPEHRLRKDLKRAPADRHLAQASRPDPVERGRWGLRLYTNPAGDACVVVGRVIEGRVGLVQNGRFAELPATAPGVCRDLGRMHVLATVRWIGAVSGGRTLLYGIADRTIRGLSVVVNGTSRPVPIAADGSFIMVLKGSNQLRRAKLRVVGNHGTSVRAIGG
jgi:hypothetical protein